MTNVQKVREGCTKTDARLRLKALKKLLQWYQEKRERHDDDCPLCNISCTNCPWYLFTGGSCSDYRDKHFRGHYFGQLKR